MGCVALGAYGGGTGGSRAVGSRAFELARAVDFCLLVRNEEGARWVVVLPGFEDWLEGGSYYYC